MKEQTPTYAKYPAYCELVAILEGAGISITYGEIWADSFPNGETAAVVLGHEAAHILLGLDSPDAPADRYINEAQCDYVGGVLFKLAEMTAGARAERELMRCALERAGGQ